MNKRVVKVKKMAQGACKVFIYPKTGGEKVHQKRADKGIE